MSENSSATVRVTRSFSASAERVFDAFLDPSIAGRFMFATPTGTMVRVEIDPRVGGHFRFTDRRNGEDVDHTGEYLEIDRPRRLVFTLHVPKYAQNIDRVVVEIEPESPGCTLTLTHQLNAGWAEHRGLIEAGWGEILDAIPSLIGAAP